jgi:hypothetical protein
MVWELTMRFHALNAVTAAAVLGLFVAVSTVLTWKKDSAPDFVVTYSAAALTAIALSIATHESMAFLVLLLAMLALCEYKFVRGGMLGIRMLVAAAADCATWLLIVIYRAPASERVDYPSLGSAALAVPATVLLAISVSAVAYKTAFRKRRISGVETVQSVVVFLLWILTGVF